MANKIEKRNVATQVRAEKEGVLVGRALSYNMLSRNLGGFVEQIAPGCFKASMAAPDFDCKALVNHDSSLIIGRTKSGTLQLEDRADGLYFRVQLDLANPVAQSVYSAVSRGDMDECSFAFSNVVDDFDAVAVNGVKIPRRTVKSATLMDISTVTYPAYSHGSTTVSARSFDYGKVGSVRGGYSAQEIADLLAQLDGKIADQENRSRAQEIGLQLLRDLKLADDGYDKDGNPRSIEDFLSSRIMAKFGPSRMGHASRYVLKHVDVSAKGPGSAMAGVCHCYDFGSVPMGNVRFEFVTDAYGKVEFSGPEEE